MLPIQRDNKKWKKINSQFLKGGFEWYNQRNPRYKNWYYLYYILGNSCQLGVDTQKQRCKNVSRRKRRNKVTSWLRNIEKFEEIHNKYELNLMVQ